MSKQMQAPLFSISDFREYVRAWAQARGRGEFRRIATALSMHTTLVSQVFRGKRSLTEEQAARLSAYLGLNSLEADYFLKLVQIERAGTEDLRRMYLRHLQQLREQSKLAKYRVPESKQLTEEDRAVFCSSWQYGVVRLLTSIEGYQSPEVIAVALNISTSRTREILEFLVSRGLCGRAAGKYSRTGKNTHVDASSQLVIRHHQNWRAKANALLETMNTDALAFSAPVAVSLGDFEAVRTILLDAIAAVAKVVEASPSEQIAYFGLDWLKVI